MVAARFQYGAFEFMRITTLCSRALDVAWNGSVHIIKTSFFFSESQPQSEPSRFTSLCHEHSLGARKGCHVNLTLFQFAALCYHFGSCAPVMQIQPKHGIPARANGTGGIFFSPSQSIFYLLASPGLQLSTWDEEDDVNANDDVIEKQRSPSPLVRHDLLGFFISFFRSSSSSSGRWREVTLLEDSINIVPRCCVGGGKTKHSAMATALKAP